MDPDKIADHDFAVTLWGYAREQVQTFRQEVAEQVTRLQSELAAAGSELKRTRSQLAETRSALEAERRRAAEQQPEKAEVAAVPDDRTAAFRLVGHETERILLAAEQAAEEIHDSALRESAEIMADARTQVQRSLEELAAARRTAEEDFAEIKESRSMVASQLEDVKRRLEETITRLRVPVDLPPGRFGSRARSQGDLSSRPGRPPRIEEQPQTSEERRERERAAAEVLRARQTAHLVEAERRQAERREMETPVERADEPVRPEPEAPAQDARLEEQRAAEKKEAGEQAARAEQQAAQDARLEEQRAAEKKEAGEQAARAEQQAAQDARLEEQRAGEKKEAGEQAARAEQQAAQDARLEEQRAAEKRAAEEAQRQAQAAAKRQAEEQQKADAQARAEARDGPGQAVAEAANDSSSESAVQEGARQQASSRQGSQPKAAPESEAPVSKPPAKAHKAANGPKDAGERGKTAQEGDESEPQPSGGSSLDALLAEIRRRREQEAGNPAGSPAAPSESIAESAGSAETLGAGPRDGAKQAIAQELEARHAALGDLPAQTARRLKRLLQEDHNDLLDRMRTRRGKGTVADNLAPHAEQLKRFQAGLSENLGTAFAEGRKAAGSSQPVDPSAAITRLVERQVLKPLRAEVSRVIEAGLNAEESSTALSERVSDVFRVWKGVRTQLLGEGITYSAYHRGLLDVWGADGGATKRWVLAEDEHECPNDVCRSNSRVGAVDAGSAFPSGHQAPPAHGGCTCGLGSG